MKSSEFLEIAVKHCGSKKKIKDKTGIANDTIKGWEDDKPILHKRHWQRVLYKLLNITEEMNISDKDIASMASDAETSALVLERLRYLKHKPDAVKAISAPQGATHRMMDEYVRYAMHNGKKYGFRFMHGDWVRSEYVEKQARKAVKLAVAK